MNACKKKINVLESYIFLDIQDYCLTGTINLNDIPVRIELNREPFTLTGAIGFEQSLYDSNLLQYYTYCRSVKKHWSKKDDQGKDIQYIKINKIKDKICIIMYVRTVT